MRLDCCLDAGEDGGSSVLFGEEVSILELSFDGIFFFTVEPPGSAGSL